PLNRIPELKLQLTNRLFQVEGSNNSNLYPSIRDVFAVLRSSELHVRDLVVPRFFPVLLHRRLLVRLVGEHLVDLFFDPVPLLSVARIDGVVGPDASGATTDFLNQRA